MRISSGGNISFIIFVL
jgi:centractin